MAVTVQTYAAPDGSELALRAYPALRGEPRAAIVYLHGIESHGGWFHAAAKLLQETGYSIFCLDRRGSGLNREERGFVSGHVDSFRVLIADVRSFLDGVKGDCAAVFLAGLSWGGKLALATALAHPTACDGLVLITPGLRALADIGVAARLKVALTAFPRPKTRIDLPLTPEMFSVSPEQQEFIRSDPLRLNRATSRFLFESWRMEQFIDHRIAGPCPPIQLILAGRDRIIDNAGVLRVLRRRRTGGVDVVTCDDQTHAIQLDAPDRLTEGMDRWMSSLVSTLSHRDG